MAYRAASSCPPWRRVNSARRRQNARPIRWLHAGSYTRTSSCNGCTPKRSAAGSKADRIPTAARPLRERQGVRRMGTLGYFGVLRVLIRLRACCGGLAGASLTVRSTRSPGTSAQTRLSNDAPSIRYTPSCAAPRMRSRCRCVRPHPNTRGHSQMCESRGRCGGRTISLMYSPAVMPARCAPEFGITRSTCLGSAAASPNAVRAGRQVGVCRMLSNGIHVGRVGVQ